MSPVIRTLLFVAPALVALCATPARAQEAEGRITGVVHDASGGAVPGVTVTVAAEGRPPMTAATLADGSYAVEGLAAGTYTVTAALQGFREASRSVRVAPGETATLNLTLQSLALQEEVTVTGTRVRGRTATETLAPVDIIDSQAIQNTGAMETGKALQLLEPSFNFSSTTISDGTDIIRPATLRGLGPDQVLVLVNGKRRHQQALMNVQQTIARGSAGYDINAIPASSIDRIEVLRDGSAAQYGSDAIAGVINVILKAGTRATDVSLEAGQHYAENPELLSGITPDAETGRGRRLSGAVNTGFDLGNGGFVNLTGEYRDRGETNRAVADSLRVSPPAVVQRIGDADSRDATLWLNAGLPAGDGQLYAFGGYSDRRGNSSGFFRSAGDGRTVPDIYPSGFLPTIVTEPKDLALTAGYRGTVAGDWTYDLSASYGSSEFQFREENTVNVSYWYEPTDPNNPLGPRFEESALSADTGQLQYDQLGLSADFAGVLDWGIGSGPLNVAAGAEWRQEGYKIEPGEEVSYEYGRSNNRGIVILDQTGGIAAPGTQGFPGWSPSEAVDEDRRNLALYLDFESALTEKFLAGAAVRFEDYSDFGSTINGKLSGRVNFTDRFSLRGTVSTGFRAPSVHQAFYSQRSTNLNAAGILTDTLTARQDSAITRAFGILPLEEETSRNYSVGLVTRPAENFRVTVDLYRIDIEDRIVLSSYIPPESASLCGTPFDPTRCPVAAILNPLGIGQVQFFTNAVDTKTDGLDIVAVYDWQIDGDATVSLEGAFHFNETEVTDLRSPSSIISAGQLFDATQVTLIEEGQPRQHHTLSATYRRGSWRGNLRFNYFGEVAGEGFTPGFKQVWGGKWLTDVSLTAPIRDNISLTIGALNLFDVFPDDWDPTLAAPFPQLGFQYGWETLPFGINGGYYFARLNFRLNH